MNKFLQSQPTATMLLDAARQRNDETDRNVRQLIEAIDRRDRAIQRAIDRTKSSPH